MKNLLVLIVVLLLGMFVLAWFKPQWVPFLAPARMQREAREEQPLQLPPATATRTPAATGTGTPATAAPKLYRWTDAKGRLTVTDQPPAAGDYEVLQYHPDTNVLPSPGAAPAEPPPQ